MGPVSFSTLKQNIDVIGAAMTLEDLLKECREANVHFFSLLEVPIDGYGMPPLAIETARCDFEGAVSSSILELGLCSC